MREGLKVRTGPDGLHLFSRRTGTNILINELLVSKVAWSLAPRQISIALTNACDLRCSYCYAPKHSAQLAAKWVETWLDELDQAGCLYVGFGGGEPTLHRDFVRLCEYAAKKTKLAVSFTTHSHRLTREMIAALKGNVHFVRVSMDGVGKTYEALRGRNFGYLLDKLELIRTIAPFGINFVVNSHTMPDIDHAISIACDAGASEFLLLPERETSKSRGIDVTTRTDLGQWVSGSHLPMRMSVSEADAEGLPVCRPLEAETGLRSFAHIDAEGFLKRSSFDPSGVRIDKNGVLAALRTLSNEGGGS